MPEYVVGSGNVFADIGRPDAETMLAKAELARRIAGAIAARGLTQVDAAAILGIDQPKVSAIVRGRLRDFSLDRLRQLANRIGLDVSLVITDAPGHRQGRTVVIGGGAGAA